MHLVNSVPIYHVRADLGQFDIDQTDLSSESFGSVTTNNSYWEHSKNFDILSSPKFAQLKRLADLHVAWYQHNVCGVVDQEFYITRSWLSQTQPGNHTPIHCHENSLLSGVIYLTVNDRTEICFKNSVDLFRNFRFNFTGANETAFNKKHIQVPVVSGDVLIWPSWVEHWTTPNLSDQSRVCVAFDVFVRGQFGDINLHGSRVGLNRLNLL